MKKRILILILTILIFSLILFLGIYFLLINQKGCGKNNFGCFYSAIENDCQNIEMEVEHTYTFIDKITQKFLFTLSNLPNGKCGLNIKVIDYTDAYSENKEFDEWLTGKESSCEFEKEELIQTINGFEKYAKLKVLVLDDIKKLLKQNCEGAYITSLNAIRFKKDSGVSISEGTTCIDDWCFQEVS